MALQVNGQTAGLGAGELKDTDGYFYTPRGKYWREYQVQSVPNMSCDGMPALAYDELNFKVYLKTNSSAGWASVTTG